jgi:hypothetical protein
VPQKVLHVIETPLVEDMSAMEIPQILSYNYAYFQNAKHTCMCSSVTGNGDCRQIAEKFLV